MELREAPSQTRLCNPTEKDLAELYATTTEAVHVSPEETEAEVLQGGKPN